MADNNRKLLENPYAGVMDDAKRLAIGFAECAAKLGREAPRPIISGGMEMARVGALAMIIVGEAAARGMPLDEFIQALSLAAVIAERGARSEGWTPDDYKS